MTIDWAAFTPLASLSGGMLIGCAAVLLFILCGRIAGISGIVGGLLTRSGDTGWRVTFVSGLVVAPLVYLIFSPLPSMHIGSSYSALVVAGLLVGFGARFGSGCTSGHGVCGLSRRSLRSAVATLIFMVTAFLTRYVLH